VGERGGGRRGLAGVKSGNAEMGALKGLKIGNNKTDIFRKFKPLSHLKVPVTELF
jgi:hypothetical protein